MFTRPNFFAEAQDIRLIQGKGKLNYKGRVLGLAVALIKGMTNLLHLNQYRLARLTVILTAVGLLTACGSGGGSEEAAANKSAPPAPYTPYSPVKPVLKAVRSNFVHPTFPPANAVDGASNTFLTTFQLNPGDVKVVAFEFEAPSNVATISIQDNYSNQYALGDLEIQTSGNSTDGLDGQWVTVKTMSSANNNFINGHGIITLDQSPTKWIRFKMTYNGTGAYGGSPSFYLSEVTFQ